MIPKNRQMTEGQKEALSNRAGSAYSKIKGHMLARLGKALPKNPDKSAKRAYNNNEIERGTFKAGGMTVREMNRKYQETGKETPISGDALARRAKGQNPVWDEGN